MQQISYPLQCGEAITLQGEFGGTAADFSALARLTCTEWPENKLDNAHVIGEKPGVLIPGECTAAYQTRSFKSFYDRHGQCFRFYIHEKERINEHLYRVFVWHFSIISGAIAALLRGQLVQLMHCSMLEQGDKALLLLGESGIGKSTTMRRWQAAGGEAEADDMVLLEYLDRGDVLVHRLPTWSACRESLDNRRYRFDPPLKLDRILAISRDESQENIREIPRADFYAQLYRCGFFHYLPLVKPMQREEQMAITEKIRYFTDRLTEKFPPQALFAHLDADINKTLGEWL